MKRALASLAAIALVIGLSLWWHNYVHGVVNDIDNEVEIAFSALEKGDMQACLEATLKAHTLWDEAENVLSLFLSHNLLDGVDLSFETLQTLIECGDDTLAATELTAIRHTLYDLQDSMEINVRNIL